MVDPTEESYPGRADFDHDLDDFDELLKVQFQSSITPHLNETKNCARKWSHTIVGCVKDLYRMCSEEGERCTAA